MHKVNVLENGLKVVTKAMDSMESVSIGIWVRTGGRYETLKNSGISHLLEHLLFKGTDNRGMKDIKQAIEGKGGSFNGFTSEEFTCYLVKVLAKDAELGVDILSDMVLNPRIDKDEVEKEKSVIIEEINMYKDIPSHYVHEILAEMMWPGQPLGMPLAGTAESVRSITQEELVTYRKEKYNPKNILLVAAGQLDEKKMVKISEKYLSATPAGKPSNFERVTLDQKTPRLIINSKETEQTHMALGLHTLSRLHPDKHAASILNVILGANMSSRLFHIVRDEMALCYEISSSIRRYEDTGVFVVSAGVDHKKLLKAIEVILKELGRLKSEPVSEEELGRAKEYYKGQLLFALEDTMSHMLWLGEKIISQEKDFSVKNILEKIESVKPEDLMRVSKDIFRDENINMAVIGPTKEENTIKEMLRFK